jgi:hypothetical protein
MVAKAQVISRDADRAPVADVRSGAGSPWLARWDDRVRYLLGAI